MKHRTSSTRRLPDGQINPQPLNHVCREINGPGVIAFLTDIFISGSDSQFLSSPMIDSDMLRFDPTFHPHFATKGHFKQLGASIEFLEHPFVVRRCEVWNGDFQCWPFPTLAPHSFALTLAADSINAPRALLNRRRVPTQVVMDYVPALSVQVNPFLPDRC